MGDVRTGEELSPELLRTGLGALDNPRGFALDFKVIGEPDDADRWRGPWMPTTAVVGASGNGVGTVGSAGWTHGADLQKKQAAPRVHVQDYGDLRTILAERAASEDPTEPFSITVHLEEADIIVAVDPENGPRWGLEEDDWVDLGKIAKGARSVVKPWPKMTITEQPLCLLQVAKKILLLRKVKGLPLTVDPLEHALEEGPQDLRSEEEVALDIKIQREERCARQKAAFSKQQPRWKDITVATVTENHTRKAKGMLYGLEFPWTEKMLGEFGAKWLTEAFHAAGTLEKDNKVVKIILDNKVKITTGNNGGKFLFDVKYEKPDNSLHTQLFAKVPFPLEGVTRSDRLSSSVNKQPSELYEINTYRLLEADLPVKVPKFYFGDISNETSNWILITERVKFDDPVKLNFGAPKARNGPLAPWAIEGPYDKCMDHCLRGVSKEYYLLLIRKGAMIGGMYKAGKLGSEELLRTSFACMCDMPFSAFHLNFGGASGEDPRSFKTTRLAPAISFITETASVLFPSYVRSEDFKEKFRQTLLALNGYKAELSFWKHSDQAYIALTHPNMNVDNAYFWRDENGKLDLGVFDWGAFGSMCVGHRLWWWIYCADFEPLRKNLPSYIDAFIESYEEFGGPPLDKGTLRLMVILTAMEQMIGLISAIPQILGMCPRKEWPTIKDRYDPRIGKNVNGKSTLRLYLHCMRSIIRIIEEMDGDKALTEWMDSISEAWNVPRKTEEMLEARVGWGA